MAITKLIILDAGHNEKVAGKESPCKTLREWKFNDDMQRILEKRCKDHEITVYLTNPYPAGKGEIGLGVRCEAANSYYTNSGKPKTMFISLHANAYSSYSVRGTETFVASNASTASKNFGKDVNTEIVSAIRKIDSGAIDRGLKVNDFYVIKNTICPCVLLEYAFYTNTSDLKILKNNKTELVEATMKSICKYFGITYKPVGGNPPPVDPPITPEPISTYRKVIAGSFSDINECILKCNELKSKGYQAYPDRYVDSNNKLWYRLVCCKHIVKAEAYKDLDKLKALGYKAFIIIYNK